jgi:hypothetical protein
MDAKSATPIPCGPVVPSLDTKSGPHAAVTATAIHITTIASDARDTGRTKLLLGRHRPE